MLVFYLTKLQEILQKKGISMLIHFFFLVVKVEDCESVKDAKDIDNENSLCFIIHDVYLSVSHY